MSISEKLRNAVRSVAYGASIDQVELANGTPLSLRELTWIASRFYDRIAKPEKSRSNHFYPCGAIGLPKCDNSGFRHFTRNGKELRSLCELHAGITCGRVKFTKIRTESGHDIEEVSEEEAQVFLIMER